MAKHRRQLGSQPPDDNCCSEWGTVSFKRTVSLTEIGALEKQRTLYTQRSPIPRRCLAFREYLEPGLVLRDDQHLTGKNLVWVL